LPATRRPSNRCSRSIRAAGGSPPCRSAPGPRWRGS